MTNVIDFLEKMGQNAQLRDAPNHVVEKALIDDQVDERIRAAILGQDEHQLEQLLGADANVCCIVAAETNDNDPEIQMLSVRAVTR